MSPARTRSRPCAPAPSPGFGSRGPDQGILPAEDSRRTILGRWESQSRRYQIVSVRKPEDDSLAGHIPHALNLYWPLILENAKPREHRFEPYDRPRVQPPVTRA